MTGTTTGTSSDGILNSGSRWHRWDPHIHTPETLFNNQFKGDTAWEDYFSAIEKCDPPIRAIAVTDYYLTDKYETVLSAKADGRLPDVGLIFPNVELRLDVGTSKGKSVNIHLLVSPEDPDHLTELRRFLSFLQFEAFGTTFACTPDDLTRKRRMLIAGQFQFDDGKIEAFPYVIGDVTEGEGFLPIPWLRSRIGCC